MKVVYIARTELPSQSANGIHVAKLCDEFNQQVDEFLCILNGVYSEEKLQRIKESYGLSDIFKILGVSNIKNSKQSAYRFASEACKIIRKYKPDKVITRDPITAFMSVLIFQKETVLDIHGDLRHLCGRGYHLFKFSILKNNKRFHPVGITNALKLYYEAEYGFKKDKMLVIPDGVTLSDYELDSDSLGSDICNDLPKIGFAGSFKKDKGIDTIAKLSQTMLNVVFCIAGGTREQAEEEIGLKFSENTIFYGYLESKDIPKFITSMDILLLPNREKQNCNGEEIGKFTSPIKMFEYMASGVPIVASNVSALREVLDKNNSWLVDNAEDIEEWKEVIEQAISNKEASMKKLINARQDVQEYTWKRRAEKMIG